jgi:uncharacterized membrane protein YqjE
MTALSKPYGTYQRFDYQTVDLEPMKRLGIGLLKLVAILFIALALVVVAFTLFQVIVFVSQFIVGWFAVHSSQVLIVGAVFVGAWKVKP